MNPHQNSPIKFFDQNPPKYTLPSENCSECNKDFTKTVNVITKCGHVIHLKCFEEHKYDTKYCFSCLLPDRDVIPLTRTEGALMNESSLFCNPLPVKLVYCKDFESLRRLLNEWPDSIKTNFTPVRPDIITKDGRSFASRTEESLNFITPQYRKDTRINSANKRETDAISHYTANLLCIAAKTGFLEGVNELLLSGTNVHITDSNGNTPLHLAATNNTSTSPQIIRALFKAGASIEIRNKNGLTPLHSMMVANASPDMTSIYKENSCNQDALKLLIAKAKGKSLRCLEIEGKEPDAETRLIDAVCNKGLSAVGYAVATYDPTAIHTLYKAGASLNVKDNDGNFPIHSAAKSGNVEIINLLINAGASPNVKNNDGNFPIHSVAKSGNVEIINLLINARASLNVKNKNDQFPHELLAKTCERELRQKMEILQRQEAERSDEEDYYCTIL